MFFIVKNLDGKELYYVNKWHIDLEYISLWQAYTKINLSKINRNYSTLANNNYIVRVCSLV